MNIIFLNAPPNSGKDTVAEYIVLNYNYYHHRFKDRLYKITSAINGLDSIEFEKIANDRNLKDTLKIERDLTARQLLIETSENVIKPYFGNEYFSDATLQDILNVSNKNPTANFIISDCGFQDEYENIVNKINCKTILININRDGCSFDGDSRSNVYPHTNSEHYILHNNSSIENLYKNVDYIMSEINNKV